jgi:hypothetical protein
MLISHTRQDPLIARQEWVSVALSKGLEQPQVFLSKWFTSTVAGTFPYEGRGETLSVARLNARPLWIAAEACVCYG